jgi:hypothetical protein
MRCSLIPALYLEALQTLRDHSLKLRPTIYLEAVVTNMSKTRDYHETLYYFSPRTDS